MGTIFMSYIIKCIGWRIPTPVDNQYKENINIVKTKERPIDSSSL